MDDIKQRSAADGVRSVANAARRLVGSFYGRPLPCFKAKHVAKYLPVGQCGPNGIVTLLPGYYRLNRSWRLEGKRGSYNGKPITSAARHLPRLMLVPVRVR